MRNNNSREPAVVKKIGKSWNAWFAILDKWDAAARGHKATAKYLLEVHQVSPWWSQTITIEYEKARGLRVTGQRDDGTFEVSVQRSLQANASQCYTAFTEPERLNQWFTHDAHLELRTGGQYRNGDGDLGVFKIVEPHRRLRFTWNNPDHCPGTMVNVLFVDRDDGGCTVQITHSKIKDRAGFEGMKTGWTHALDSLKSLLEA